MKKYENNDSDKSLEKQFAERVEMLGYTEAFDKLIALLTNAQRTELMGDPHAIVTFLEGAAISSLVKGDIYKLVQTVFGQTITQVSELLTKEIKRLDMQKTIDTLISIDKRLRDAGIDPKIVNLDKILLPSIQAISLEDNHTIQEIYTNLLTVAIAGEKVDVKDINNIKLLEANDVLVLEAIYQAGRERCQDYKLIYRSGLTKTEFQIAIDGLLSQGIVELTSLEDINILIESALSNITRDRGASEFFTDEKQLLDLDLNTVSNSLQNALKLIIDAQTINKYDYIKFTARGWEFMRKCKGILTKTVENDPNDQNP